MLYERAVEIELGAAAVTFVASMFVVAPYGRHVRDGWGPSVSARRAWMVMETPAVLGVAALFALGRNRTSPVALSMLCLWLLHYVRRAWIYPARMTVNNKPMPILVVALAVAFNSLNAVVNGGWISDVGVYPASWFGDGRFLVGTALFLIGFGVNVKADAILVRLRSPGDRAYHVPHGWLYQRISCPNYFGEMVEWLGWAILTWSLAGAAFALYTAANLVPRALAHHRWYRAHFPDYPSTRKAVIPGLL